MRYLIFTILLGLAPNMAKANLDSLFASLTHKNDSNDCKTYQSISNELALTHPDSARIFAFKALKIAKKLGRFNSIGASYHAIGLCFYYESKSDSAAAYWQKGLFTDKKHELTEQAYFLSTNLGIANSNLGNYDSARYYFEQAKESAVITKDSSKIISSLLNMAVEDFRQGYHDKAIQLNLEVLQWYKNNHKAQYNSNIANVANNLSSSFIDFTDWQSATNYALLGKKYAQLANGKTGLISSYTLLGIIKNETAQYDSSQVFYNKALAVLAKNPNALYKTQLLNNKGHSFINTLNYDSAFYCFSTSKKISQKINAPLNKTIALLGIGEVFYHQTKYDSALFYAKTGFQLAKSYGLNTDKMQGSQLLSRIYEKLKNADSAYFYLKQYQELNDSFTSIDALQRVKTIEQYYKQREQKAKVKQLKQINLLNKEKLEISENKNNLLYIFLAIMLIILGVLGALLFVLLKTKRKLQISHSQVLRERNKLEQKTIELNAANKTLNETQEQLIRSEKMASIGQLTAGIAHEINNPINFVKAGIDSLKLELEDVKQLLRTAFANEENSNNTAQNNSYLSLIEELDSITETIANGANRTAEIVKGLRIYARNDQGEISKVNINDSLETALLLLNNSLKDRITITKEFENNVQVEAFAERIDQVILNLLSNAAQAIKDTGEITLRTRADAENVTIDIIDNGVGIPKDKIHKIFDPFFTTKPVGQGTGLGLSISQSIIKAHNGSIKVKSENGLTTFSITLPKKASIQ